MVAGHGSIRLVDKSRDRVTLHSQKLFYGVPCSEYACEGTQMTQNSVDVSNLVGIRLDCADIFSRYAVICRTEKPRSFRNGAMCL